MRATSLCAYSEFEWSCPVLAAPCLRLNMVGGGLKRLLVYGHGFNSQGWPGNLGQDHIRVCFEINLLDSEVGLTVSSIICDH